MLPDRWLGPVELLPAASVPVAGKGARETVDRGGADEKPRRDAEAGNVRRRYGWRLKFPEQRLNPGWLLGLTLTTELGGVMIGYMAQVRGRRWQCRNTTDNTLLMLRRYVAKHRY